MYRVVTVLCLCILSFAGQADEVMQRLQRADGFRQNAESVRVDIEVKLYKGKALDKTRLYRVYVASERRSLVLARSAAEQGQKILMQGDQYHLFMPRSRRAIRITPLQKLLGEASTGDVSTMTWHEDYSARLLGDQQQMEGVSCRLLELRSAHKGTTYERIELYLSRDTDAPVYARLYLGSGKLAKEASYRLGEINGKTMVVAMSLVDRIKPGRRTEIRYLQMAQQAIPAHYFNPQYLARNPVE